MKALPGPAGGRPAFGRVSGRLPGSCLDSANTGLGALFPILAAGGALYAGGRFGHLLFVLVVLVVLVGGTAAALWRITVRTAPRFDPAMCRCEACMAPAAHITRRAVTVTATVVGRVAPAVPTVVRPALPAGPSSSWRAVAVETVDQGVTA